MEPIDNLKECKELIQEFEHDFGDGWDDSDDSKSESSENGQDEQDLIET